MAQAPCRRCGAEIAEGFEYCVRCLVELGLEHAESAPERLAEPEPADPARDGRDPDVVEGPGRDRGKRPPASPEKGARFGPYEVIAPLGAGGMGEVYLAEDARLDRKVALKILRGELARKQDHLKRFEREARLLASLSHPNIAALYGLEESAGVRALVLELIDGPTLRERIEGRPMRPPEAARIARQIAEALESAHARGILHRDLKPTNIKVTPEGSVKVLDFGLAKILEPESTAAGASEVPTVGESTQAGVIMGTVPYMSPEQIRGEPLDFRTDNWAFGCVLYEMLTGRAAFSGKTTTDIAAAILEREPDWSRFPRSTPAGLVRLVRRSLEKDPRRRIQHIGDARAELEEILEGRGEPESLVPPAGSRFSFRSASLWSGKVSPWALGAALSLLVVLAVLLWPRGPTEPPRQTQRVTIVLPEGVTLVEGSASYPLTLTPDGETLLFAGRSATGDPEERSRKLYLRRIDSFEPEAVPGTDEFEGLAISPHGSRGATTVPVESGSSLRDLATFALAGGSSPVRIAAFPEQVDHSLAWLPDDTLVFRTLTPLMLHLLTAEGETRRTVEPSGIAGGNTPWTSLGDPLPGGRHLFLYDIDSEDVMKLFLLDVATGESRLLMENAYPAHMLTRDILLFSRRQTLLAVRFDQDRLETVGAPVAVLEDLPDTRVLRHGQFAAKNGTVAYALANPTPRDYRIRILSRDGSISAWDEEKRIYHTLVLSPDGKRIAAGVFGMRKYLDDPPMIGEVDRPELRTLSKGPEEGDCYSPAFSPDGRLLAYRCSRGVGEGSSGGIYLRSADGRGTAEKILDLTDDGIVNWSSLAFSADSSRMMIRKHTKGPSPWLSLPVAAPAADPEKLDVFLPMDVNARDLQFSPDGTFIVYAAEREGSSTVYARPISPDGGLGEEIRLSPQGGSQPRLRTGPAGLEQEVVYVSEEASSGSPQLMSVRVRSGSRLTVSEPAAITGGSVDDMRILGPRHAVLPDGGIIFVQSPPEPEGPDRIQVILNFDVEVRRKLEEMEDERMP